MPLTSLQKRNRRKAARHAKRNRPVAAFRRRFNLSQDKAAPVMLSTKMTVSRYERGVIPAPDWLLVLLAVMTALAGTPSAKVAERIGARMMAGKHPGRPAASVRGRR